MKIKEIIQVAFFPKSLPIKANEHAKKNDKFIKTTIAIILAFASLLMTFMNAGKSAFMAETTTIICVAFIINAVLVQKAKNELIGSIACAILIAVIFTTYVITGASSSFAVLWVLLVPPISMTFLGLRIGIFLSLYFQILLVAVFYTPLREMFEQYYSATFMTRFPILYLTDILVALFVCTQSVYYQKKIEKMIYADVLTGAYNRRYYADIKEFIEKNNKLQRLSIISIDINGLKQINDSLGHTAGDELISVAYECQAKVFDDAEAICRIGGDEFAILTYASKERIEWQIKELSRVANEARVNQTTKLVVSAGVASNQDSELKSTHELELIADRAMYAAKNEYYRQNNLDRRKGR